MSILLLSHRIISGWILSGGRRTRVERALGMSEEARGTIAASRVVPARNVPSYIGWREVSKCTVFAEWHWRGLIVCR